MLQQLKPYWPQIALGLYILLTEILAKIPKVRANTVFELIYNPVAKALRAVPFVGKFADLFDTPQPVSASPASPPASAPRSASGGFVTVELVIVLSLLGIGAGLLLGGCAPGADGLRQACTNADQVLTAAYQAGANGYASDQEALRAQLAASAITDAQANTKLAAHKGIVDKVLAVLDGLKASKTVLCSAIPAVEAGQRNDSAALIASIGKIVAAVPGLLQAITTLTSYLEIPPTPIRMTRAEVHNV